MRQINVLLLTACVFLAVDAEAGDRDAIAVLQASGANVQWDETRQEKPLRHVTCNLRQVTDETILALKAIEDLPSIEFLGTGNTEISVATLRALQGKKSLNRLSISRAKISDDAAAILGSLKSLDTLHFPAQIEISPAGLDKVFQLTHLNALTLSDRLVNDEVLEGLAKFTALKTLNVHSVFVTDHGLASLRRLKNLQNLQIYLGTETTAEGLKPLEDFRLKQLEITYFNPNDAVIKELRKVRSLKTLRLLNAKNVTENSIPSFAEMAELKELSIIGSKYSLEGVKELKRAMPGCKVSQASL